MNILSTTSSKCLAWFGAVLLLGASSAQASKDNHVHFQYFNDHDVSLQAVVGVDLNSKAGGVPYNACPTHEESDKTSDFYEYIGLDTQKNASYYSGQSYSWSDGFYDDDKYSCVSKNDLHYVSETEFYLRSERTGSKTVANFFAELMDYNSSLVVVSNPNAFGQDEDGNTSNGLPEKLNFMFMTDLLFNVYYQDDETVNGYGITCPNIVFAQQGDDPFNLHWKTTLAKQGASVTVDALVIDEEGGVDIELDEEFAESVVKDAAKDVKALVKYLTNKGNIWWMGQWFDPGDINVNFAVNSDNAPAAGLPQGQYQHAFVCSNSFLMMVAGDTDADHTFNVQFVRYHFKDQNTSSVE